MAYSDMLKWRITDTLADLQRSLFLRYDIPSPSQVQYKDHSQRISQGEGGMARHGYRNLEVLWLKLTPGQADTVRDFVESAKAGSGLLYMTVKPLEGTSVEWMDVSGKPDLSDIAPDAPVISASGYIHSNIKLTLNNVTVIDTTPTF
jgi:hypothetical protein